MARPPNPDRRAELLEQASLVLARTGVVDTSLRTIAAEIGTSARMLAYHFHSKEELILEVLAAKQVSAAGPDLKPVPDSAQDLREQAIAEWDSMMGPHRRSGEQILLQVFGASCADDSPYSEYTATTLTMLIERMVGRLRALGAPEDVAATRSHLTIAAIQGLVIQHFTGPDGEAVARRGYIELIDTVVLAPWPSEHTPN
ncbi:TetR/AcrR family transcriptional regulator [Tsukamurella pulmonis]|uniref:TetR/AcrR family transcriptional regulator n=1 Tax=Tsukamurella pulmonis TaxID=47312 RepID=UPI000A4BC656|nr:TetR/AcrR family transcriptional regulator [Tsukamurella pulmonis]